MYILVGIWLLVTSTPLVSSSLDYVSPIKAFAKLLNFPLKISVLVCWNYDARYKFVAQFQQGSESYLLSIKSDSIENIPVVKDEERHLIIVDLNCSGTALLLEQVDPRLYNRFKWTVLSHIGGSAAEYLTQLPLLINSEVYSMTEHNGVFYIKEVYRKGPNSDIIFEPVASFSNGSIVDERISDSIVHRRKNLEREVLRASMVVTNKDTLNHLHDYRDKHVDTITKVNYLLTNYLMEYLNASVNYKIVSQWGYKDNKTGKWSGMIGDLVENRSDIGATGLFVTSDRIQYIEYIAMPSATRSKFVFHSPKLSYTNDVFLLPFNKFVWYCLVALFLLSVLALVGTVFAETQLLDIQDFNSDASVLKPSFYDTFILVLAATCQQGSAVAPKSFTARVVMIVTYITLMFLYTSYSANITALLQSPSTKIQTLEDLLNSRLKFGADDTVFNRYYFTHATEPVRHKIYEQKILQKDGSENFLPLDEGVNRIRHGLFAFHMELGVGYKIMGETYLEHEKCGLQEIQYLQVIDPWYAIQKNSSYKEFLKTGYF
ncbi:unnamed protein product [Hermetia illucens]|uniref:Uncharacterized protein n=1 Tax=Hermetia illucens TaxID=343691 RepID=A0A7R8YLJ3_HERIL|nr:unnamed protein product [Hermetia illucens]